MKKRVKFTVPRTMDIISKSQNAGKLGIRLDRSLSKKMPDFVKQGISQKPLIYQKNRQRQKRLARCFRTKFEQTKHKEIQRDIAGFEAGKVDDYNFRGKGALKYNPLNAAGEISQTGGYNAGGDEDYKNKKDKDVIINPRFKLGKKVRKVSARWYSQSRPLSPVLDPDGKVRKLDGFFIKVSLVTLLKIHIYFIKLYIYALLK